MTDADIKELNCTVVPAYCIVDNKKVNDSVEKYRYNGRKITTRVATATDFYNTFCALSKETKEIICITPSRKIASTYDNAVIAAKACWDTKIEVIDSKSVAGAIYFLASTCRALEGSGAGFSDIVNIIQKQTANITATFTIKDPYVMNAAKRLGIISPQSPIPILNQRPVCRFDPEGNIVIRKNARGMINMVRELIEDHKKGSPRKIAIYYSEENMQLKEVLNAVHKTFDSAPVISRRMSQAIRANTGEDVICIVSHSM